MNKLNGKKLGVTLVLVGALAAGAIGVSAQQGNPPAQPGQGQGQEQRDGMGFFGGGQPGFGQEGGRFGGRGGRGGDNNMRLGGRGDHQPHLLQAVMDATGLNLIEIGTQVRSGSTLGEIVTANGGTIEAVVAQAVSSATDAITQAVTDGELTQEQADAMIAQLEERFTNVLNGEARGAATDRMMDVGIIRLAAELTGLNGRDIAQEISSGTTLSTILTDNGVDVTAFVAEATERAEARINVMVANDRVTAEEAAELLAQFSEELNTLLNTANAAL